MSIEKVSVKLLINSNHLINEDLMLFEEAPDDENSVLLELTINGEEISNKSDNFFFALRELRKELEKKNIQILCNGAAKNVFPSPMQLSMGTGRKAYKLNIGQQAKKEDVIDIFGYDENLNFVGNEEQSKFYDDWIRSIMQ